MAIRTTPGKVEEILLGDYDGTSALTAQILGASKIVDRMVTCAAEDDVSFDAEELELIERYVAAYRYTLSDPLYTSRSTSKASGSFQGEQDAAGKPINRYLKAALDLDPSGCLRELLMPGPRAGGYWLGKAPSEQTDYDQRD